LILYHDTDAKGFLGIMASERIHASTRARNPRDVRYGNGQYFSDIPPGSKTPAQLSREFLNLPFFGTRFTHYVAIESEGLAWIEGRPGVFLVPNEQPLDISGRIVASGLIPDVTHS
jgi:HYD1 signature containing ADP-ribosyltransferase